MTTTINSLADYTTTLDYLKNPPACSLTWDAQRELLHTHEAPEHGDWPAPHDHESCTELIRRLPLRARCLCALVLAEMVLPLWEQWA